MKDNIEKELNSQLNAEMYSAYLYYSMAAYLDSRGLSGFSHYMKVQAQEEFFHARKFYDFIIQRGGKVELGAIEKPKSEWVSVQEIFSDALKHERYVTSLIDGLMDLAVKESDHASQVFLQWFVQEQVEEEDSAKAVLDRLELTREASGAMFMLDKEMAARQQVFTEVQE